MPPAFWELVHDERSVGCTVHWVDDKLDTGAIAGKTVVSREPYSTLRGLQLRLDQVGVELMRDVVAAILRGEPCAEPQPPGGKTFRKPTLAQVAMLARKMRAIQPAAGGRLRQLGKNAVARVLFTAWRLGLHRLAAPRLTVLLYHRVSDEARDNLTVGIEQFDRQMALLRRYCRVVSIEEAIAWTEVPRTAEPLVCITFDDGYLDNYEHAAPILERHQLPAAFFVSTGIVASDKRFPHDVRRNNPPLPVMQWDQMRAMRERGFTLGSHSVLHIDCAGEPEERVRAELAQSREDLARELGVPPAEAIFAYPYGGRQHMTPARLELVKQASYRACLSAYGGSNVRHIDRWNVLRRGIQWEFSDAAFLLECIGVR
jgi:peptidoglycan/xylan/chitin deacetylase (PgdA/CDA1 family)